MKLKEKIFLVFFVFAVYLLCILSVLGSLLIAITFKMTAYLAVFLVPPVILFVFVLRNFETFKKALEGGNKHILDTNSK